MVGVGGTAGVGDGPGVPMGNVPNFTFGVSRESLVGRAVVDLMRPEYREGAASRMAASDRGERSTPLEFRLWRR